MNNTITVAIQAHYADKDFQVREEGDHILILEHLPCGEIVGRFSQTGVSPEAVLKACEEHIRVCPKYGILYRADEARRGRDY